VSAYEVVCASADRDEWLGHRASGIGASEAAHLLGWGWGSPLELYSRKLGLLAEKEDTEAMWWGRELEAKVAQRYGIVTARWYAMEGNLIRSSEFPFAIATLDAWTRDHQTANPWPLEIKTASAFVAEDWEHGPPPAYLAQVQWQMMVAGSTKASVACLLGGQRLVWCDVERDEGMIDRLVTAGAEMWDRIQRRDPPAAGSGDGRLLGALYPHDDGSAVELGADVLALDDGLPELEAQAKAIGVEIDRRRNGIKAAMGEHTQGRLPDGTVYTWKAQTRAEHIVKASTFRVLRRKEAK
jgi:putative phage-type endonuclease